MQDNQEDDIGLLALSMIRAATDNGNRTDLYDFIEELRITEN